MISGHLLWWGTVALLLFWSVGAYNRLVRLRSNALRTFATLALLLQRGTEHAQSAGAFVTPPATELANASETLDPLSSPTPSPTQWTGLQGAAAQFAASLTVARARPLDAETMDALGAANAVQRMAWQRLVDECQALADPTLPESLLVQWDEIYRQTAHAAEDFAVAIQSYNAAVTQFPAVLLAALFGFRKARALEIARP